MSTLIVLGNTNPFTFANSIVAANCKALELFNEGLTDVFVIHSNESQIKLNNQQDDSNSQGGWIKHLEDHGISQGVLTHRIIEINATSESIDNFIHYIELILNGVLSKNPNLIVDLTNGTSLHKNILSTMAYILDLGHEYLIDITKLGELTKERGFLSIDILKASYVSAPDVTKLDSIAYLNLANIVRYKRLIQQHTDKYVHIDEDTTDRSFFAGNLTHSISLKLQGDRKKDNALYRIAVSSISASVEDLITILIDKFTLKGKSDNENRPTFGKKLRRLESELQNRLELENADFEFLTKFNDFMLYLRNSTTHKGALLTDVERFKGELAVNMSFPFIEFYTDIIYPVLQKEEASVSRPMMRAKRLANPVNDTNSSFYFGLDGDNTGSSLEELFKTSLDEGSLKRMSSKIVKAIEDIKKHLNNHNLQYSIVFAAGDDVLFKGVFNEAILHTLQELYKKNTEGMTCSIGYGKTLLETHLALKLAKTEPGKNSIVGIELV